MYDQALAGDRRGQSAILGREVWADTGRAREAAAAEQVVLNQVIDNGYLPVTVENPQTPPTRTLTTEEATAARTGLAIPGDGRAVGPAGKELV